MTPTPGEWIVYTAGRLVICPGVMDRRAELRDVSDRRTDVRRCDQRIMRVGDGKEIHIRRVAKGLEEVPRSVTGTTRHCHWCKNVTEFKELPTMVSA